MTKIQKYNDDIYQIGKLIKEIRLELSLSNSSRQYFIEDRIKKGLLEERDISEKTFTNIENGHNLPSLVTLKRLSPALEIEFLQLMKKIEPLIPR